MTRYARVSRPRRRARRRSVVSGAGRLARQVCDRFDHPIDVLDLGCGTGRYFWGLRNVEHADRPRCVGADARRGAPSDRTPIAFGARPITLVKGDLATHAVSAPAASISSIRSACWPSTCRSTRALVERVRAMAQARRPLCLHHRRIPQSPDVPRTLAAPRGRRGAAARCPAPLADALHRRLMVGGHVRRRALDSPTAWRPASRSNRSSGSDPTCTCTAAAWRGKRA